MQARHTRLATKVRVCRVFEIVLMDGKRSHEVVVVTSKPLEYTQLSRNTDLQATAPRVAAGDAVLDVEIPIRFVLANLISLRALVEAKAAEGDTIVLKVAQGSQVAPLVQLPLYCKSRGC